MDELHKLKQDELAAKKRQKESIELRKKYSSQISLPSISKVKREELENRKKMLSEVNAPKLRPEKPVVFDVKSYKTTGSRSVVDWDKVKKNPWIKEPK